MTLEFAPKSALHCLVGEVEDNHISAHAPSLSFHLLGLCVGYRLRELRMVLFYTGTVFKRPQPRRPQYARMLHCRPVCTFTIDDQMAGCDAARQPRSKWSCSRELREELFAGSSGGEKVGGKKRVDSEVYDSLPERFGPEEDFLISINKNKCSTKAPDWGNFFTFDLLMIYD